MLLSRNQAPSCCSFPPKHSLKLKQLISRAVVGFFQSLRDADTQVGYTSRSFPWHLQPLSQPVCLGMVYRGLFKQHLVQKHPCSTGQLCAASHARGEGREGPWICPGTRTSHSAFTQGLPHSPDNAPQVWQVALPVHHHHNLPYPLLFAISHSPEPWSRCPTGDTTVIY